MINAALTRCQCGPLTRTPIHLLTCTVTSICQCQCHVAESRAKHFLINCIQNKVACIRVMMLRRPQRPASGPMECQCQPEWAANPSRGPQKTVELILDATHSPSPDKKLANLRNMRMPFKFYPMIRVTVTGTGMINFKHWQFV